VTRSIPVGAVRPLGDRSFLIGVEDAAAARLMVHELQAALAQWIDRGDCEVLGGLATVMVMCQDIGESERVQATVDDAVHASGSGAAGEGMQTGQLVTVQCVFDGEDLSDVAALAASSTRQVCDMLTGRPLSVAMVGFSPGFAFLEGLPEELRGVPRRERPRPAVPAGSVAVANGHAAIYPSASPGGWHLVGRTAEAMFFPDAAPHARLAAGDRVQLVAVDTLSSDGPPPWQMPHWEAPPGARRLGSVTAPGVRTVLQDGGRRGMASLGVPAAGPADPSSFALANRLVGNRSGQAAVEVTAHGPTLRLEDAGYVAVVGASPQIRLDGQAEPAGQVFPVRGGQELSIGAVRPGLHTYLAVAGGFVGPAVLGSVATDQLSGLGPGPLQVGDVLLAGTMTPPLGDHRADVHSGHSERIERGARAPVSLRVVPGPHPEWFAPEALARLAQTVFRVEPVSNRVGMRLGAVTEQTPWRGGSGVGGRGHDLDSQGMVYGAIQVPPDDNPVVLMSDHATHGGYPVLAVVATVDLGRLGQCAPGDTLTFEPVELDAARALGVTAQRVLGRAVMGRYPLAVE
jgi:KipI family sensor histidine kinase inhibitor